MKKLIEYFLRIILLWVASPRWGMVCYKLDPWMRLPLKTRLYGSSNAIHRVF